MTVLQVKVEKYILLQLLFFIRGFGEHLSYDLSLHATSDIVFGSHIVGSKKREQWEHRSRCSSKLFPASSMYASYHFGVSCSDAPHLYSISFYSAEKSLMESHYRFIIDLSGVFNFRKYLRSIRLIDCVCTDKTLSNVRENTFHYTGVVCARGRQCSVWYTKYTLPSSDSEVPTLRPKLIYFVRSIVFYAAYVPFDGWDEGTLIFTKDQTVFLANNTVEFYDPLGITQFTDNVFVGVEAAEQNVLAIGFDDVKVFTRKTITRKQQKLNPRGYIALGSCFDRDTLPLTVCKKLSGEEFTCSRRGTNIELEFPETVFNVVAFHGGFGAESPDNYYHVSESQVYTIFTKTPQLQISSDFFKVRISVGSIIINDFVQPLYKPWTITSGPAVVPTVSAAGKSIVVKLGNGVYEVYDGKLNFFISTDTTAPVLVEGHYLQMVSISTDVPAFRFRQYDPTIPSFMQPLKSLSSTILRTLTPTCFAVKELGRGEKVFAIVHKQEELYIGCESGSGDQRLHQRPFFVYFEGKLLPIDRYLAIHFVEHEVTERLAPLYIVASALEHRSLFFIEVSFPLDQDRILETVIPSAIYRIFEDYPSEFILSIFFIRGERNWKNSISPRSHNLPVMAGVLLSYTVDTAPLNTTIPQTTIQTTITAPIQSSSAKPSNDSKNNVNEIVAAVVVAIHLALISIVLFIF